jgi:2-phosphoglycerate kinase
LDGAHAADEAGVRRPSPPELAETALAYSPAMRSWTVLFIGGPAGTRKTTVAKNIASRCSAQVLQADDVQLTLQRATGRDERPVFHFFAREKVWDLPVEVLVAAMRALAQEISAALETVVVHHLKVDDPIVIEGVWITPDFVTRASLAGSAGRDRVRSVFIDERDKGAILEVMLARGRGIQEWPPPWQDAMATLQSRYGTWLRDEAEARGLPLVPARPVETLIDRVLAAARV